MKKIEIVTDGTFAIVDDSDFELASQFRWYANKKKKYVFASIHGKTVSLHRFLLGLQIGDKREVDHINRDPRDCRRSNLRICTRNQNLANRRHWTGKYKGVSPHFSGWVAQIKINKKAKYLGFYKTPEEAAKRYNEEAVKVHGEYALLNKI